MTGTLTRRPSDAALAKAGELLYRELERLAIEKAENEADLTESRLSA